MDHYPYPPDPIYPPARAPHLKFSYLAGRDGDCSADFSSFPSRNGWDKAEFLEGELRSGRSPEEASAFLQAWLFFGLVSSVLGIPPQPENDFVVRSEEGSGSYLSTKKLPAMIETWTEKVLAYDKAKVDETIRHASMCLDEAALFSQAADGTLDGFRLEKVYPEVKLSIMALGDQLQSAVRQLELKLNTKTHKFASATKEFFGANTFLGKAASKMEKGKSLRANFLRSGYRDPFSKDLENAKLQFGELQDGLFWKPEDLMEPSLMGPWNWGPSELLRKRMEEAGWCPYEAARLQDILSPWAVHYASALRRPILSDINHKGCTEFHCRAHTVDESTYKPRHVEENCDCELVHVPLDEVKLILDEGGIPVLKLFNEVGSTTASIVVGREAHVSRKLDLLYAVSHVWSHGLGNATDNALPRCQIVRLINFAGRDISKKEKSTNWLWVDTLCVPLEHEYRKLAISRLSKVYYNNYGTMVIDRELAQMQCKDMKPEEVVLRVFCSSWMQRMWTMQEGANDQVMIAFADGQMNLPTCLRTFQLEYPLFPIGKGGEAFNTMTQMIMARVVPFQYSKILHVQEDTGDFQVMRVWNGMRWRQATKPGDESIILAALLFTERGSYMKDYKADTETFNRILHTPAEDRWTALYQARKTWPQGILFVNCKTISEKGLRWAPNEVGTYGREISDSLPGAVTPRGLVIKRPGYLFLALRTKLDYHFEFLDVAKSVWYSVTPMDEKDVEDWPEPKISGGDSNVSFALVQSKHQAGHAKVSAVIGSVEEILDEVIHMELVCKVRVAKVFPERKRELDKLLASDPQVAFGPRLIRTASYGGEQKWCIG